MNLKWFFSFVFVVFLSGFLTVWNYQNREYHWDMPGYIASVYKMKFPDSPKKVHEMTFGSIKKEAPSDQYDELSGKKTLNIATQVFERDAKSFSEQVPYYEIKVGYNLTIFLLQKAGLSPPMSVLAVSLLSYFFSAILIFFILKIIFPENWVITVLLVSGIMFLPPLILMSRTATPDLFVFQFILIFILGLLRKWEKWTIFMVLFMMTLIRPDYIPFTLTYLAITFLFQYKEKKIIEPAYIVQACILLGLYIMIVKYYQYPGWKNLFYDSLIYRRPTMSAQAAVFSVGDYLSIIFEKLIHFKKITLSAIIFIFLVFKFSNDLWIRALAVLFFVNLYIKFLFFPLPGETRFFFSFLFGLFILMLCAVSKRYNGFKLNKIA